MVFEFDNRDERTKDYMKNQFKSIVLSKVQAIGLKFKKFRVEENHKDGGNEYDYFAYCLVQGKPEDFWSRRNLISVTFHHHTDNGNKLVIEYRKGRKAWKKETKELADRIKASFTDSTGDSRISIKQIEIEKNGSSALNNFFYGKTNN